VSAKASCHSQASLRAHGGAPTKASLLPRLASGKRSYPDLSLTLVDRVPPRPDQRDGDRGEQEHALQLQRPAALVVELAQLAHVRQAEGEQHVDRDDDGANPSVEADRKSTRRQHLADQRAIGDEAGQATGEDHALRSEEHTSELQSLMPNSY